MSESPTTTDAPPQLEGGTYEIIRNRLRGYGEELRTRLGRLNDDRKDVFGSIDVKLLTTERITTEHNCVPRDMVAVGGKFLFGYNVHFGLKTERHVADVFAAYEFRDRTFHPQPLDLLADPQFEKDFQDVYRYYKNATFAKFFVRGPHLFMVFQVGKDAKDIKSFKWLIEGDSLRYLDNRSDHEVRYPPQHEFEWVRCTRDMHRYGTHPHVSIADRVFVETVGGDLTIKVEDNTDSGRGIYSEPVDNADQTLDDSVIHYAIVGNNILLKIRPYQEAHDRYFVFNEKIQQARRLDSIAQACVLLPDDQGLIFANGYYLQTGEQKTFDSDLQGLLFERRIISPNGEDTLYVFYQPVSGDYVLLGYNIIEQQVETPYVCNGFTLFEGGAMVMFKAHHDAQKHHAVQVWQTPYIGEDFVATENTDSYLYKIGNRDIVRGMAECREALALIDKEDTYAGLYVDLVKVTTDLLDSYFWIGHEDAHNLAEPLTHIRDAASAAVEEFEKVVRLRRNTAQRTEEVEQKTREELGQIHRRRFEGIDDFVKSLAGLRGVRGEIIGLKELRYVDLELVESLENDVAEETDRLSHRCVEFLLRPNALKSYEDRVAKEQAGIGGLTKVADAKKVEAQISESAGELEMLIEIVSNLKIEDATHRTAIIDNISAIFAKVNAARAGLKRKIQELASVEGAAEFGSQLKLLNQSVVNFLDVCDSPAKCEEYLTKLMVQVEELEGRFAEFDDFVVQLAEKRDEVYNAFETRRLQLVEARNKRAAALASAADRILKGIKSRVDGLESINDIHGYFASDLMIEKVRDIVGQLDGLGDSVKVDDIRSRLKTIQEDAVRQLKDKQELYEDGENIIRFGNHRFSVNTQVLDLTTVLRNDRLCLHLTGTDFYEAIQDPRLDETRDVWNQELVSESPSVYRAEYLAYVMLHAARAGELDAHALLSGAPEDVATRVQQFMAPRYREGYTKGVHDQDAARLLRALLEIDAHCGLLRFDASARALARLFWENFGDNRAKSLIAAKLAGHGFVLHAFPKAAEATTTRRELRQLLEEFVSETGLDSGENCDEAAAYLVQVLANPDADGGKQRFAVSQRAADLFHQLTEHLHNAGLQNRLDASLKALKKSPAAAFALARDWTSGFVAHRAGDSEAAGDASDYIDETALCVMNGAVDEREIVAAETVRQLGDFVGSHSVIKQGKYQLNFNRFLTRLDHHRHIVVPRFDQYHELKSRVVDEARDEMKLEEFRPRVLTSFVRNQLIDKVYLPLIGDNLAKQIGSAGENKRTDRQGLLLLISPPGYGKTTLMEYIANRLGIIFMKINGPALGHDVTSLDPAAAPNAGAREEIEKLNLAFEMGDNVMIYLDDIQHCHPELLQKFISLCDAQRKIEGVYKGKSRTYDFRGKKVCVVMAGNPYTESGEKFRIPDMLSNRADIYNLGEIIGDSAEAFELSYLENSLTSNPVLARLAARSRADVTGVIKIAQRTRQGMSTAAAAEGIDLEGNYALDELGEYVSTMAKLLRVRDVVLTVNREYIRSAATHDDYRTEPPFLLQGSYRNMNRIAERVLPVMNDEELEGLVISNYQNDAQTLTSGTEANLLKFKELLGILSKEEQERWDDIRRTFRQNVKLRGVGSDDKVGLVIAQLSTFADGLDAIRKSVAAGAERLAKPESPTEHFSNAVTRLEELGSGLQTLSQQVSEGLTQIARLADRPMQIDVPPIDVRWPESLPALTAAPTAAPSSAKPASEDLAAPDRITIVNRLPKTVYNVLEQQFQLMQGWMKPLMELAAANRAETAELKPLIQDCLKHYRVLLRKLEQAHDGDVEEG